MRKGDTQPQLDALTIFKHAARLAKGKGFGRRVAIHVPDLSPSVIVEVAITKRLGTQLVYGLEA